MDGEAVEEGFDADLAKVELSELALLRHRVGAVRAAGAPVRDEDARAAERDRADLDRRFPAAEDARRERHLPGWIRTRRDLNADVEWLVAHRAP